MKFGLCCAPAHAQAVLAAGFDYVELPATVFKPSDEVWDESVVAGLVSPVCNMMFPGTMKLLDPEPPDYLHYARILFSRAETTETKCFVIGSGSARKAPRGVSVAQAEERFVKICA